MKKKYIPMALAIIALVALTTLTWAHFADPAPTSASGSTGLADSLRKVSRSIGFGRTESATGHNVQLSTARVSVGDDGKTIIAFDAKGDLPGSFTMTLSRGADGQITAGYWAMIVSYTDLTPLGHSDNDGDGQAVNEALVQKGTLSGTVTGGTVTVDAAGAMASVDSVQLNIEQGSVAFADVAQGSGSAQGSNLQDTGDSTGSLTLTF